MAELTPCGRVLLTPAELLRHKSEAYRDGYGDGLGSTADALAAIGLPAIADQVRASIEPALAAIRDQAAERTGVELSPWRRL